MIHMQPYPLFAARVYEDGTIVTGRVVGWKSFDDEGELQTMHPLVVRDGLNGEAENYLESVPVRMCFGDTWDEAAQRADDAWGRWMTEKDAEAEATEAVEMTQH